MSERFESIQKGVEEAIEWKNGKKTGARVRTYTGMNDIIKHLKTNRATKALMTPAKGKVTSNMLGVYRKEANLHVE